MRKSIYELYKLVCIPMERKGSFRLEAVLEFLRGQDPADIGVTNDLYKVLAVQCDCDWRAFERSIRTLKDKCWENNGTRELFQKELNLTDYPRTSEFIKAMAYKLERMEKGMEKPDEPVPPAEIHTCV